MGSSWDLESVTSGTAPLPNGNDPEMHRRPSWARPGIGEAKDWAKKKDPGPVGLEEASPAKWGDGLLSEGTEKAPQKTKAPKARDGLVGKRGSGPLEDPRPLGTEGGQPQLGVDPGKKKKPPSGEPTSLRGLLSKLLAKLGCLRNRNATSGETPPGPDGKAASKHSQHGQPISGINPASGAGNTTHGKPPICEGKPGASGVGDGAHGGLTSAGKPASGAGQAEHGKTPKPAPHEKPGKPKPEDEPKDKDDDDDAAEKDLSDDDNDDDNDDHVGGDTGKGSNDADEEDAFDKELDYGLAKSPFDAYAYHDAWSDDDDDGDDNDDDLEGGSPKESFDFGALMKPIFDIWGDLLTKAKPEGEAALLTEGVGYNGERPALDVWGDIVAQPRPES